MYVVPDIKYSVGKGVFLSSRQSQKQEVAFCELRLSLCLNISLN